VSEGVQSSLAPKPLWSLFNATVTLRHIESSTADVMKTATFSPPLSPAAFDAAVGRVAPLFRRSVLTLRTAHLFTFDAVVASGDVAALGSERTSVMTVAVARDAYTWDTSVGDAEQVVTRLQRR
jgi:hypothetical protein